MKKKDIERIFNKLELKIRSTDLIPYERTNALIMPWVMRETIERFHESGKGLLPLTSCPKEPLF